ncbi:septum formation inhibitor Maf [Tamlana agarivorans]|uniref:Septum formation inhibitor Maf n=1 Tax=Pseudotamlana agarivorans TaxID=481183 RepID=A0ACC5UBU2_9FLAO|nr:septum formation inhibitor Maf [Tamlana agarivorans]MBU2951724.1 septum formation inhibitor Maf [Tamlana agarivorans]
MGKFSIKTQICFVSVMLSAFLYSCNQSGHIETTATPSISENTTEVKTETTKQKTVLSSEFKKYWYAGEAEISSYKLEQARYGEIREGTAVLIFVTEDFLPLKQVKADNKNAKNVPVLKLNATKNFNTGIYPYSIMQSVFYPISNNQHALKVSNSIQEWCGHVYDQLNNREQFEITSHSYFEGEADEKFNLGKTVLENELWAQLRIDPKSLPVGEIQVIPSLEFTRLKHVPIKAFQAMASIDKNTYSMHYPELNRTLSITYNPEFPFDILSWEESFKSGFGEQANLLTTKATKLKTIKSPYWKKNHNKNEKLRTVLLLD